MATHVLLALLSTGPVGISDAVGATNATLVRRMIRSDGTLLKPARPIVAVDATLSEHNAPAGQVRQGAAFASSAASAASASAASAASASAASASASAALPRCLLLLLPACCCSACCSTCCSSKP